MKFPFSILSRFPGRFFIFVLACSSFASAQNCFPSVLPSILEFPPSGGIGSVSVNVPLGCSWGASCSGPAIQFGGGGGTGPGGFNVTANANGGPFSLQGSCTVSSGLNGAGVSVIVDPPGSTSSGSSIASSSANLSSFLDPTGVTTGKPAGQSIFYRGTDAHLHHIYSNTTWLTDDPGGFTNAQPVASGSSISSFLDPTGVTTGKPAGQSVYYVGTDQHVHHVFSNTTWFTDDPTAMTGATLAASGSPTSSFLDVTGVTTGGKPGQAIFYIGTDQHVHHFFTDTTWHTDDPTANSGAPLAESGGHGLCSFLDPTGATTGSPGQAIFYIGTDHHVHHIYSNTTWHTDDPTAMTGAPLAATGSSLTCFLDPTGVTTGSPHGQSIFYIGTDQHVHHLYSNTAWHHDDPTAMTGAPLAATGSSLSSFLDKTGVTTGAPAGQSIFYIATDQHVHHIYSNTTWHTDDPTAMTSSPVAATGSPLSSFLDPTGVTTGAPAGQSIFFIGTNGHVYQIYSNTTWFANDTTGDTGATLATF